MFVCMKKINRIKDKPNTDNGFKLILSLFHQKTSSEIKTK